MKGMAKYVENNSGIYRRVEVCAEVGGVLLAIDLTNPASREVVENATSIHDVYKSKLALKYK